MAINRGVSGEWGIVRGPQMLVIYLLGFLVVYIGERLIGGAGDDRYLTSALGVGVVLFGCLIYTISWRRSTGAAREAERVATGLAYGGLAALVLYFIRSDLVMGVPAIAASDSVGVREVLSVVWPIILVGSAFPLVFIQWHLAVMDRERIDLRRVYASASAGATTALFLATLFLINAIAVRKDVQVDLSYFKTSTASDSSIALVEGLDSDVDVLLFFPPSNEVLEQIRSYFEGLARRSGHLKLAMVDRALEPALAKLHRVAKDGTVILARGDTRQKIELGADIEGARRSLRKLDGDFQSNLLKLLRPRGVAYMITGHGERTAETVEGNSRARLSKFKSYLEGKNYSIKTLSGAQGLAVQVPDDAAFIMLIGPTGPLFPGELDSIRSYLEQGGHLLLMLDPEAGDQAEGLLASFGITFAPAKLANDRAYGVITKTRADIYNLATNRYSSHPAVSTVSRHSNVLPIVIPTSGYLEGRPVPATKVDFLVRSLDDTWNDRNSDMQRGAGEEKKAFQLAAAISKKVEAAKAKPPAEAPDAPPPAPPTDVFEMRAVVFADADVFSDDLLQLAGNQALAADVVAWLVGEPSALTAPPSNEEDIPIAHTRGQEVFWFYGTIFVAPLLIVGIGLVVRFGRGRKRRAGK